MARWPATSCDPFQFFKNHSTIFDTTLWYVIAAALFDSTNNITLVVTGLLVSGLRLVCLDKNRVVPRGLVLPVVKTL